MCWKPSQGSGTLPSAYLSPGSQASYADWYLFWHVLPSQSYLVPTTVGWGLIHPFSPHDCGWGLITEKLRNPELGQNGPSLWFPNPHPEGPSWASSRAPFLPGPWSGSLLPTALPRPTLHAPISHASTRAPEPAWHASKSRTEGERRNCSSSYSHGSDHFSPPLFFLSFGPGHSCCPWRLILQGPFCALALSRSCSRQLGLAGSYLQTWQFRP